MQWAFNRRLGTLLIRDHVLIGFAPHDEQNVHSQRGPNGNADTAKGKGENGRFAIE